MRAAPPEYDLDLLQYTPRRAAAGGRDRAQPRPRRRGDSPAAASVDGAAEGRRRLRCRPPIASCRSSDYAGTYRLARRLTAGAPTVYDAVRAVERHLPARFTYSERPPSRKYPLEAFLFEDKIGYCQQFSGRDGPDAADGRDPRARGVGLLARVAQPRHAASTASATSTPTRGWRCTSPASAGSPSIPRPPPRRPTAAGEGADSPLGDRPHAGRGEHAGLGRSGLRPRRPTAPGGRARAAAARGGGGPLAASAIAGRDRRRWRGWRRAAGAARRARPTPIRTPALRELERALPRLGWALARRHDAAGARAPAGPDGGAGRRRLRRRGCARAALARAAPGRPAAAARRALRRELTAARGPARAAAGLRRAAARPAAPFSGSYAGRLELMRMNQTPSSPLQLPRRPARRARRARRSARC